MVCAHRGARKRLWFVGRKTRWRMAETPPPGLYFPARPPTILAASARTIQSDPPTASRRRDRACAAVPESLARPATRRRPAGVRAPRLAPFPLFILTKDQCIDTDVGVTDWPPDGKN